MQVAIICDNVPEHHQLSPMKLLAPPLAATLLVLANESSGWQLSEFRLTFQADNLGAGRLFD